MAIIYKQYILYLFCCVRAIKTGKGVNSKKEPPIHRVADVSGDVAKARQFLPFLQRAGRYKMKFKMLMQRCIVVVFSITLFYQLCLGFKLKIVLIILCSGRRQLLNMYLEGRG